MTPEQIAAMATALRHPETWNGSEEDYAEGLALAADMLDHQAAELADTRSKQTYRYIGKDGKMILARDLEDQRDALSAEIATLRAERDAAIDRVIEIIRASEHADGALDMGADDVEADIYAKLRALKGGA